MRSLKITMYAHRPVELPLAYSQYVQGMLYSCWRQTAPDLHDGGFYDDETEKVFRLFTFSQLEGRSRVNREKKTISFEGSLSLEVRSPDEELLDHLAGELAGRGEVRLGHTSLPIVNLSACDRLLFPPRALVRTLAPITLHRTLDDGYTDYLEPGTVDFAEALQSNAESKARSFDLDAGLVQLLPWGDGPKKRVVKFKGTYITGWTGEFVLAAQPQTMQFLYSCGLGARNSQGFGMFEIIDRPL